MTREVVSDRSAAVWTQAEKDEMLKNASVEIASLLGFPQDVATGSLSNGVNSISAPADILSTQINQLIIGNSDCRSADLLEVLQVRARVGGNGTPEVFNYDPRKGKDIEFAPALATGSGGSTYFMEYTTELDVSAYTDSSAMWDGLFPQFHWLIPIRAGVNAWRSVQDFERARAFLEEYGIGIAAFASFLGQPNPMGGSEGQQSLRLDTAVRS